MSKGNGTTPLAPYTHFSFCPKCGFEYETWDTKVEFRCYECDNQISLKKNYPFEFKENPSCRWYE